MLHNMATVVCITFRLNKPILMHANVFASFGNEEQKISDKHMSENF